MYSQSLSHAHRQTLLSLAANSIRHGFFQREPLPVVLSDHPPELHAWRSTFITLYLHDELQGCIGTLRAFRPLAFDVSSNAYEAAYSDPRARTLSESHLSEIKIHISVLSTLEPVSAGSEDELLAQVRPGIDGLIMRDLGRSGTLLPSVWENIPDAREFIQHVKRKAGYPPAYWSGSIQWFRYTTEYFG